MIGLHPPSLRLVQSTRPRPKISLSRRTLFSASLKPPASPIRRTLTVSALTVSLGLVTFYYLDSRAALHRYFITPLIRNTLDAETGHKLAVKVLKSGLAPRDLKEDDGRLKCELWEYELSNPVGLAAGFDKDGEAVDGLFNLGFSWVEIGSVTPKPQTGNAKPRVFHLQEDSAIINRYGFPSKGHSSVLARLKARTPASVLHRLNQDDEGDTPASDLDVNASFQEGSLLAVNLGKNKESAVDSNEDFVEGVLAFGPYADVLVVNVSSPNTPGLRGLQDKNYLGTLLSDVTKARDKSVSRRPKLVLKIAPDLDEAQLIDVADAVKASKIDGVIVSNTTIQRPSSLRNANKVETGGLSGGPLKSHSLKALRILRSNLPSSIPLIGCGGISTGADALEFAEAGASMVQAYTSFAYDGVGFCRRVKDELTGLLEARGETWAGVVRTAIREKSLNENAGAKTVDGVSAGVAQLIREAEELMMMLEKFGEKVDSGVAVT